MTYKVYTDQITETVAPTSEPVSVIEAKVHLRIDNDDSDTLINAQIKAARQWVENYCQRSLVARTYRADVEGFAGCFDLPMKPLSSISSIKYYTPDSPQVLTTLDSTFYRTDTGRGQIYMDASSTTIPNTATRRDAVQITFVTESSTDEAIKSAIKLIVGDLYEHRERNSEMRIQTLDTVEMLLAGFRNY